MHGWVYSINRALNLQMLSLASNTIKLAATFLPNVLHHHVTSTAKTSITSNWSSLPEYSLAQVSRHSYSGDCWIVIRDKVYDVTKFIHQVHQVLLQQQLTAIIISLNVQLSYQKWLETNQSMNFCWFVLTASGWLWNYDGTRRSRCHAGLPRSWSFQRRWRRSGTISHRNSTT